MLSIQIYADSKITAQPAYLAVTVENPAATYRLDFPTMSEDLVLACDTLIGAIERVRDMAPPNVR